MTWYNGCGCGDTPERLARMNRITSDYLWSQAPSREIEQSIGWLEDVVRDCEFKIAELETLKANRERSKEWRQGINEIARQFYDEDSLHLSFDQRYEIVRQRIDAPPHRLKLIAERIQKWADKKQREHRNADICFMARNGQRHAEIAAKYDISRQQVYNIVKNDDKMRYLR